MHIIPTKEHHSKNNFSLGYGSNNDRLQKKMMCIKKRSCRLLWQYEFWVQLYYHQKVL